jgi:hypothetical protein
MRLAIGFVLECHKLVYPLTYNESSTKNSTKYLILDKLFDQSNVLSGLPAKKTTIQNLPPRWIFWKSPTRNREFFLCVLTCYYIVVLMPLWFYLLLCSDSVSPLHYKANDSFLDVEWINGHDLLDSKSQPPIPVGFVKLDHVDGCCTLVWQDCGSPVELHLIVDTSARTPLLMDTSATRTPLY